MMKASATAGRRVNARTLDFRIILSYPVFPLTGLADVAPIRRQGRDLDIRPPDPDPAGQHHADEATLRVPRLGQEGQERLAQIEIGDLLGDWDGYEVTAVARRRGMVEIELNPVAGRPGVCTGCGQEVDAVHGYERRRVRDLPLLGAPTSLILRRRRLACPRCGPKLERLNWLVRYARVTQRLADDVVQLCTVMTVKQVAEHYRLGWDTVRDLDKRYLQRSFGPVDVQGATQLVLDEFVLLAGKKYATVITDAVTKRVLWVSRGHRRENVRPFFEALGSAGCRAVKAVSMDINSAYEQEVRHHCPQARIVYDLFHVAASHSMRSERAVARRKQPAG